MFWIDAVLMLICGWMGGTISTLVIRYVLEGRKPLDPALLPVKSPPLPVVLAAVEDWHKRNPTPPASPYAPNLKRVWRAAKKEQSTHWKEKPKPLYAPPPPSPIPPPASLERPAASPTLLPSIPWGK